MPRTNSIVDSPFVQNSSQVAVLYTKFLRELTMLHGGESSESSPTFSYGSIKNIGSARGSNSASKSVYVLLTEWYKKLTAQLNFSLDTIDEDVDIKVTKRDSAEQNAFKMYLLMCIFPSLATEYKIDDETFIDLVRRLAVSDHSVKSTALNTVIKVIQNGPNRIKDIIAAGSNFYEALTGSIYCETPRSTTKEDDSVADGNVYSMISEYYEKNVKPYHETLEKLSGLSSKTYSDDYINVLSWFFAGLNLAPNVSEYQRTSTETSISKILYKIVDTTCSPNSLLKQNPDDDGIQARVDEWSERGFNKGDTNIIYRSYDEANDRSEVTGVFVSPLFIQNITGYQIADSDPDDAEFIRSGVASKLYDWMVELGLCGGNNNTTDEKLSAIGAVFTKYSQNVVKAIELRNVLLSKCDESIGKDHSVDICKKIKSHILCCNTKNTATFDVVTVDGTPVQLNDVSYSYCVGGMGNRHSKQQANENQLTAAGKTVARYMTMKSHTPLTIEIDDSTYDCSKLVDSNKLDDVILPKMIEFQTGTTKIYAYSVIVGVSFFSFEKNGVMSDTISKPGITSSFDSSIDSSSFTGDQNAQVNLARLAKKMSASSENSSLRDNGLVDMTNDDTELKSLSKLASTFSTVKADYSIAKKYVKDARKQYASYVRNIISTKLVSKIPNATISLRSSIKDISPDCEILSLPESDNKIAEETFKSFGESVINLIVGTVTTAGSLMEKRSSLKVTASELDHYVRKAIERQLFIYAEYLELLQAEYLDRNDAIDVDGIGSVVSKLSDVGFVQIDVGGKSLDVSPLNGDISGLTRMVRKASSYFWHIISRMATVTSSYNYSTYPDDTTAVNTIISVINKQLPYFSGSTFAEIADAAHKYQDADACKQLVVSKITADPSKPVTIASDIFNVIKLISNQTVASGQPYIERLGKVVAASYDSILRNGMTNGFTIKDIYKLLISSSDVSQFIQDAQHVNASFVKQMSELRQANGGNETPNCETLDIVLNELAEISTDKNTIYSNDIIGLDMLLEQVSSVASNFNAAASVIPDEETAVDITTGEVLSKSKLEQLSQSVNVIDNGIAYDVFGKPLYRIVKYQKEAVSPKMDIKPSETNTSDDEIAAFDAETDSDIDDVIDSFDKESYKDFIGVSLSTTASSNDVLNRSPETYLTPSPITFANKNKNEIVTANWRKALNISLDDANRAESIVYDAKQVVSGDNERMTEALRLIGRDNFIINEMISIIGACIDTSLSPQQTVNAFGSVLHYLQNEFVERVDNSTALIKELHNRLIKKLTSETTTECDNDAQRQWIESHLHNVIRGCVMNSVLFLASYLSDFTNKEINRFDKNMTSVQTAGNIISAVRDNTQITDNMTNGSLIDFFVGSTLRSSELDPYHSTKTKDSTKRTNKVKSDGYKAIEKDIIGTINKFFADDTNKSLRELAASIGSLIGINRLQEQSYTSDANKQSSQLVQSLLKNFGNKLYGDLTNNDCHKAIVLAIMADERSGDRKYSNTRNTIDKMMNGGEISVDNRMFTGTNDRWQNPNVTGKYFTADGSSNDSVGTAMTAEEISTACGVTESSSELYKFIKAIRANLCKKCLENDKQNYTADGQYADGYQRVSDMLFGTNGICGNTDIPIANIMFVLNDAVMRLAMNSEIVDKNDTSKTANQNVDEASSEAVEQIINGAIQARTNGVYDSIIQNLDDDENYDSMTHHALAGVLNLLGTIPASVTEDDFNKYVDLYRRGLYTRRRASEHEDGGAMMKCIDGLIELFSDNAINLGGEETLNKNIIPLISTYCRFADGDYLRSIGYSDSDIQQYRQNAEKLNFGREFANEVTDQLVDLIERIPSGTDMPTIETAISKVAFGERGNTPLEMVIAKLPLLGIAGSNDTDMWSNLLSVIKKFIAKGGVNGVTELTNDNNYDTTKIDSLRKDVSDQSKVVAGLGKRIVEMYDQSANTELFKKVSSELSGLYAAKRKLEETLAGYNQEINSIKDDIDSKTVTKKVGMSYIKKINDNVHTVEAELAKYDETILAKIDERASIVSQNDKVTKKLGKTYERAVNQYANEQQKLDDLKKQLTSEEQALVSRVDADNDAIDVANDSSAHINDKVKKSFHEDYVATGDGSLKVNSVPMINAFRNMIHHSRVNNKGGFDVNPTTVNRVISMLLRTKSPRIKYTIKYNKDSDLYMIQEDGKPSFVQLRAVDLKVGVASYLEKHFNNPDDVLTLTDPINTLNAIVNNLVDLSYGSINRVVSLISETLVKTADDTDVPNSTYVKIGEDGKVWFYDGTLQQGGVKEDIPPMNDDIPVKDIDTFKYFVRKYLTYMVDSGNLRMSDITPDTLGNLLDGVLAYIAEESDSGKKLHQALARQGVRSTEGMTSADRAKSDIMKLKVDAKDNTKKRTAQVTEPSDDDFDLDGTMGTSEQSVDTHQDDEDIQLGVNVEPTQSPIKQPKSKTSGAKSNEITGKSSNDPFDFDNWSLESVLAGYHGVMTPLL